MSIYKLVNFQAIRSKFVQGSTRPAMHELARRTLGINEGPTFTICMHAKPHRSGPKHSEAKIDFHHRPTIITVIISTWMW